MAAAGGFTTVNAAIAQYADTGYGYYAPGYYLPGYYNPRFYAPGFYAPGYAWRRERAIEEWRQWQYYETQRIPERGSPVGGTIGTNKTINTEYAGECAIGFSEETCRRRGQRYNPPKN